MKTSLIITTYNRKDALALVLKSAARQKVLPDEVLVADDGSNDGTGEMVAALAKNFPVPLIHCWQEDCGFRPAAGRNLAVARADGDYFVFIDGDMVLPPDFIATHQAWARSDYITGGKRLFLDERLTLRLLEHMEIPDLGFFARGLSGENRIKAVQYPALAMAARWFQRDETRETLLRHGRLTLHVASCNLAVSCADYFKINGFNEEFVGHGLEDHEFCARHLLGGGKIQAPRFCLAAMHLWHARSTRPVNPHNRELLWRTIAKKNTVCASGLNNHFPGKVTVSREMA